MDAVNDPEVVDVVVMKSAQIGWTEILGNVVGYFIHYDPAPMLLIQPTLELGQAWSKDRLAPMLRDTDALRGRVADAKARDSGNTILHKTFRGGHLTIAGSNSPAGLASRPIRILLADEVSRWPRSAGTEGDPLNLARKRTTTFWNRKRLMGSTPTVKGVCRIEAAYEESDKRRYFVPCPHCGHEQTLEWANVQWPEGKPADAYYVCVDCGAVIDERDKSEMLALGKWKATATGSPGVAGFHISELYSPWVRWGEMAVAFLEAKKLPETLQTWVNTALGQTWEDKGETVDKTGLMERRESYGPAVPMGAAVLTAGVDVQDRELVAELVAWGEGQESWSIEYRRFAGDPSTPDVWSALDDWLRSTWQHETGVRLKIAAACVDSGGHHTQTVYNFAKRRLGRRIFATKGMAGQGRPLVTHPKRKSKARGRVFLIGADTGKEMTFARLRITEPGPGYCHFPDKYEADYFDGLTSEKVITKYSRGFATRVWVKKSTKAENEPLDCRVLALAALELTQADIPRIRERIEKLAPTLAQQTEAAEPAAAGEQSDTKQQAAPAKRPGFRRIRSRWMSKGY